MTSPHRRIHACPSFLQGSGRDSDILDQLPRTAASACRYIRSALLEPAWILFDAGPARCGTEHANVRLGIASDVGQDVANRPIWEVARSTDRVVVYRRQSALKAPVRFSAPLDGADDSAVGFRCKVPHWFSPPGEMLERRKHKSRLVEAAPTRTRAAEMVLAGLPGSHR